MINVPEGGLADHVVIAGSGRVGRSIADALAHLRLPSVLIELDDRRVRQARLAGLPMIYGDATQSVVLEAAGIPRARAMLITLPTLTDARAIVTTVDTFVRICRSSLVPMAWTPFARSTPSGSRRWHRRSTKPPSR